MRLKNQFMRKLYLCSVHGKACSFAKRGTKNDCVLFTDIEDRRNCKEKLKLIGNRVKKATIKIEYLFV